MPDRRTFLLAAAATAGIPAAGSAKVAASPPAGGEPARLNAVFDRYVQENLQRGPEQATSLGLDKGPLAALKSRLSENSVQADAEDRARVVRRQHELNGIERARLTGLDRVNYDVVKFGIDVGVESNRFPFIGGGGGPYALSQLTGAYQSVPDFLDTQHTIETAADADAYLSRMTAFARQMDQEREVLGHDVGLGVVPPDFVIDKALVQLRATAANGADKAPIVASIARRTREKGIAGDHAAKAAALYEREVRPALGRQIEALQALRPRATHDAGVWRLKDSAAYYALQLKGATTASITPTEAHRIGLELVKSHTAQIDAILQKQGYTQGTVGQRLRALYADPKQQYANTDAAKEQLITDLNAKVRQVTARLPQYFGTLPKAQLEIHRVPKAIEAGAPGGYYNPPPIDGSRPGIYWINLRDTAEVPRWTLPTLTFHEGIPGHHLQGAISNETSLPLIRKTIWFSGYGEGWALYAEQLAVEMGMYADDPLGHVGQLHDSMFRAVRLVVDSGLHDGSLRWSREQAVKYYVDTLGDQEASAVTEVERYCVWPGQACSYMVGKLTWLDLREKAKAAMGPRFDIRRFHDAGLLAGPTPLDTLRGVIGDWMRA